MNEVADLRRELAARMRTALASAERKWLRAWVIAEDLDGGFAASLRYEAPHGAVEDDVDLAYPEDWDIVRRIQELSPLDEGRRWTRATFSLSPSGELEQRLEFPVPPPREDQSYSESEIIAQLAASLRANVSNVDWTEAWIESDEEYGHTPMIEYSTSREGPKEGIRDCNYLRRWHQRLMASWRTVRGGLWKTGRVRIWPDGRTSAQFDGLCLEDDNQTSASDDEAEPLDDLVAQIEREFREEMRYFSRVLLEKGDVTGVWRKATIRVQWREDLGEAEANYWIEFPGGQTVDTFGDEEVEYLARDIMRRLFAGEDPGPLAARGVAVEEGGRRLGIRVDNIEVDNAGDVEQEEET